MLRAHIDRMGLEASGHLKVDLQQCLCDAVRDGLPGPGEAKGKGDVRRTPPTPAAAGKAAAAGKNKGGGDRDEDQAESENEDDREHDEEPRRGRAKRAAHGKGAGAGAGAEAGGPARGRGERPDQTDKSPVPALPPDRVFFHNRAVSAMTHEERREALHELDMPSLRKGDDEITHDLVDALVQRKAEAADTRATKQAWRGRRVSEMRTPQLGDLLREFGRDGAGRVGERRARFRAALHAWAEEEIQLPGDRVHGRKVRRSPPMEPETPARRPAGRSRSRDEEEEEEEEAKRGRAASPTAKPAGEVWLR